MDKMDNLLVTLLVISILLTTASYSAPLSANNDESPLADAPYVPDQIVVKLKEGLNSPYAAQLHTAQETTVVDEIPQIGVQILRVPPGEIEARITAYRADPRVEYAEPDYIAQPANEPNDPYYGDGAQWGLQKIFAPQAWDLSTGDSDVVIAVLDWGVDLDHPDLRDKMWTNPDEIPDNETDDDGNGYTDDVYGWDFANDDNNPQDDYGHGSHVAGIAAAATNNGVGIAGVAFNNRIMAVKVGDGATGKARYSSIANGIIYAADNGVKVINLSLGGYAFSTNLGDAVNYAWAAGCIMVGAAGNNNKSDLFYPAAYDNVIGVSSTDQNDVRASSSNYGSYISVAAPGVGIYSTYWNGNSTYTFMSGTSMATPHVAGLAALLFSQDDTSTNATVRSLIEVTADDLDAAGWDQYYGYGRINAYAALSNTEPTPTPTLTSTNTPMPPTATPTPEPGGSSYVQRVNSGGDSYSAAQGAYSWVSGEYEVSTELGVDWVSGADESPIDPAADWVSSTAEDAGASGADSENWVYLGTATEEPKPKIGAEPSAYVAAQSAGWDPDQAYDDGSWGYTGGTAWSVSNEVSGTTEDQLYQEYRENPGEYRYTAPSGDYEVTLRFAEFEVDNATDRQMRITIEGIVVEDALSIYGEVGKNAALDRVYQFTANDGELNILFAKNGGQKEPVVSAISVVEMREPTEPTPTSTATPVPPTPTATATPEEPTDTPTATPIPPPTPTPTSTRPCDLPGDLDCDCDVDVIDIMLVSSRWYSSVGDDNYDPAYDLDDDGDIDVVDIMLVAAHWGKTCGGIP